MVLQNLENKRFDLRLCARGNYPLTVGIEYIHLKDAHFSMDAGGVRIETEDDSTVRVPEVVQKCVGYVCEVTHQDSAGMSGDPQATGFFVCVPFAAPQLASKRFGYFITAAHVAKGLSGRPIYFLVNKRGGGLATVEAWGDEWLGHPTDRSADVAAIPVGLNPEADLSCVATKHFIGQMDFANDSVNVGDEVFITGLFTEAVGQHRVLPIVRHGNLAMLPDEQIQTDMGYADVHLIEARSIGGVSGSPVFVRTVEDKIRLLGLMHGHWDIKESELNDPSICQDRKHGVNLGIAIVVPAIKILETINSAEQLEWRAAMEKKQLRESVPGADLARPKDKDQQRQPFTKAEFDAALKKVSRKIGPKS